jgi:hypothetical protein
MFSMGFYAVTTFFVAVLVYNLALMIFLGSKEHSPRSFSLSVGILATWALSWGFAYAFAGIKDYETAAFFIRCGYFFGAMVSVTVLYFSLTYPDNHRPAPFVRELFVFATFLMVILFYTKDILVLFGKTFVFEHTVITNSFLTPGGYLAWGKGDFYFFFDIIFIGFFAATLGTLWQKYVQQTDDTHRKRALFMFWAIATGFVPTTVLNVAFPQLKIFAFNWFGLMSSFGWVSIMAYSIVKQGQMNVRTATAELLVVALILLMFIGMFAV